MISNKQSINDAAPALQSPAPLEAMTAAQLPLAVSITEFCRLTSLGRTTAFQLARDQRIEVRHVGSRTLVLMRSIEKLLGIAETGR